MAARTQQTVRNKLSELRRVCEKNIEIHQQKTDESFDAFAKLLQSHRSKSQLNAQNQVKLGNLKVELRELEDELVRALSVKTRTEAKRIALTDSLSEARVKVDELQKIVHDQAARKDKYAAILSEQSEALAESEEKTLKASGHGEEIREAFTWYNRVLGFHIDGGHGVKFTFTYINKECPTEEYSVTIRHSNEIYTLLDCKPHVDDIEDLIHELNKSNGLFRFVRIIRGKFQAAASGGKFQAAASGSIPHFTSDQDFTTTSVSLSAPVSSDSLDSRSRSPLPFREVNRDIKNASHGIGFKSPHLFSSTRRSPRIQAKKPREG